MPLRLLSCFSILSLVSLAFPIFPLPTYFYHATCFLHSPLAFCTLTYHYYFLLLPTPLSLSPPTLFPYSAAISVLLSSTLLAFPCSLNVLWIPFHLLSLPSLHTGLLQYIHLFLYPLSSFLLLFLSLFFSHDGNSKSPLPPLIPWCSHTLSQASLTLIPHLQGLAHFSLSVGWIQARASTSHSCNISRPLSLMLTWASSQALPFHSASSSHLLLPPPLLFSCLPVSLSIICVFPSFLPAISSFFCPWPSPL